MARYSDASLNSAVSLMHVRCHAALHYCSTITGNSLALLLSAADQLVKLRHPEYVPIHFKILINYSLFHILLILQISWKSACNFIIYLAYIHKQTDKCRLTCKKGNHWKQWLTAGENHFSLCTITAHNLWHWIRLINFHACILKC